MARQIIDTTTNNGTYIGDPAKIAFEKTNANFGELYTGKVDIGLNGSWPSHIPVSTNVYASPRVIQYYVDGTANSPSGYGVIAGWSNTAPSSGGSIPKGSSNWVNLVAFGTNGIMYHTFSINGNEFAAWRQIWDTGNTTVDSNNFIKRA